MDDWLDLFVWAQRLKRLKHLFILSPAVCLLNMQSFVISPSWLFLFPEDVWIEIRSLMLRSERSIATFEWFKACLKTLHLHLQEDYFSSKRTREFSSEIQSVLTHFSFYLRCKNVCCIHPLVRTTKKQPQLGTHWILLHNENKQDFSTDMEYILNSLKNHIHPFPQYFKEFKMV